MPKTKIHHNIKTSKLKFMRITRHLKQSELAELSGVPLKCIGNYEQLYRDINRAQVCIVYRLAKALDCSSEELRETDVLEFCMSNAKKAENTISGSPPLYYP